MRNLLLIFITLSLFCFKCYSQVTLKGSVLDSLQKPLSNANIIAKPLDSLKQIKFSIADSQGNYNLKLANNINYNILVSYLGYKTDTLKLFTNKTDLVRDFVLMPQMNTLDEVEIEMPVVIKQDTIIYNTDKFISGDERKLKNVLAKLPGVEVDDDGTVKVQGKTISTMLVEGKKFFGGGTKLAIDNIPADAISEIEVIDNYNEVALLKNIVDSNDMAMNVKLKEEKKAFVFGNVEAGKGNEDFYKGLANIFYYGAKTQLNTIGNINNIGQPSFTIKNYLDFNGGFNSSFKTGNTDFKSLDADLSQFINSSDVVNSLSKLGALNITQDIGTKLNISAYGIFSYKKDATVKALTNQYNAYTEFKDDAVNNKNNFGIGNLQIKFYPNLRSEWRFRTQFKQSDNVSNNVLTSTINNNTNKFV